METFLPSIYSFNSSIDGGRIARKGFIYQDHVGTRYLLNLILATDDCDIIFENEDDIVKIEKTTTPVIVEMIQVKSNNLDSRWSVSQILNLEVLQKSLKRGRCSEEVKYRVITSYDVDSDLEILKLDFNNAERKADKLNSLIAAIEAKKSDIPANTKGQKVKDWVNNCIWSKYPDSIDSLRSENLLLLEDVLEKCFSIILLPDQKQELYQKLLAFVQDSSSITYITHSKKSLQDWFDEQLKEISKPKGGTEKLIEKMNQAQLDSTLIETAKELKWAYSIDSLNNFYVSQSAINKFKLAAYSLFADLKVKLDAGELEILGITEGFSFHKHCLEKIDALAKAQNIDEGIAKGCMYDITNRCQHRFLKATV
jgi:hypothetical protein